MLEVAFEPCYFLIISYVPIRGAGMFVRGLVGVRCEKVGTYVLYIGRPYLHKLDTDKNLSFNIEAVDYL